MKKLIKPTFVAIFLTCLSFTAQSKDMESVTLIRNVNIFDGKNEKLLEGYDVLVVKNLIKKIDKSIKIANSYEIDVETGGFKEMPGGFANSSLANGNKIVMVYEPQKRIKKEVEVKVIDGKGHTLIPGLIDAHWHTTYCCAAQSTVITGDILEIAIRGALGAEETLLRGFTTVRDVGGNTFAIKRMIDADEIVGPRILPSGPPITQTGGHLDYRPYQAVPTNPGDSLWYWYHSGLMLQADGVPEVILRSREVMRMGASQIKIAAGGGVSSLYDPLDVRQYTKAELEAFVEVADTYNTYVLAHIFTDDAARVAVEAGVKSIEHGNLLSEKTLKLMKEKGTWLSVQPIINDEDAIQFDDPISTKKFIEVTEGTDRVIGLAKKLGVKMAFGTDMLFDPVLARKQGAFVAKMKRWFTPYEIMKMVTSNNAELMALSGPRLPYQEGALGVIREGAYADLILVDGNPLENIDLVADADANFDLIMKGGKIYKNGL